MTNYIDYSAESNIQTKELEQRSLGIDTCKPNASKPCLYYGNGCTMKQKCKGGWQMKDGDCELYACKS